MLLTALYRRHGDAVSIPFEIVVQADTVEAGYNEALRQRMDGYDLLSVQVLEN